MLALHVRHAIAADLDGARRPIIAIVDVSSQAYGRREELLGIHLACAATAGTDLFLTNDHKLVGKIVPGIQFIAGLESNIL